MDIKWEVNRHNIFNILREIHINLDHFFFRASVFLHVSLQPSRQNLTGELSDMEDPQVSKANSSNTSRSHLGVSERPFECLTLSLGVLGTWVTTR